MTLSSCSIIIIYQSLSNLLLNGAACWYKLYVAFDNLSYFAYLLALLFLVYNNLYTFDCILGKSCQITILLQTRGVSPDNVNFCQPVIIANQFNFTSTLPLQKTSIRTKVMDDHKVKKPL